MSDAIGDSIDLNAIITGVITDLITSGSDDA